MAPVRRRGAALCRGSRVFLVFLVAVALDVASSSPRRGLGASAAAGDAAELETETGSGPEWHVVSVADLLPAAVCTASQGTVRPPHAPAFFLSHFFALREVVLSVSRRSFRSLSHAQRTLFLQNVNMGRATVAGCRVKQKAV